MREPPPYLPNHCEVGALLADRRTAYEAQFLFSEKSLRPTRWYQRAPVEVCGPIAVQLLDAAGEPVCEWIQADILDVSRGGLCLLVVEDADLPIAKPMNLRLDVRSHPEFGAYVLCGELRWFVHSGFALTFGVGFHAPLIAPPSLSRA